MIRKNVENSGGTIRLGYSFNCSATPKPAITWDYTPVDGFQVSIGDSEITIVVSENDTGSDSRSITITPYINGEACKDNKIIVSQGAGEELGECSYEVTAAKTVINCEDDHYVRFAFKKVEEDSPSPSPEECDKRITISAKKSNGTDDFNPNSDKIEAEEGQYLFFSHGDAPEPDPPSTDCSSLESNWKKTGSTEYYEKVLKCAYSHAVDGPSITACCSYSTTDSKLLPKSINVIIHNASSYYIQHYGGFILNNSIGVSKTTFLHRYVSDGTSMHYGKTSDRPTNLVVAPNRTETYCCRLYNDPEAPTTNMEVKNVVICFSSLNDGGDLRTHRAGYTVHSHNTGYDELTSVCTFVYASGVAQTINSLESITMNFTDSIINNGTGSTYIKPYVFTETEFNQHYKARVKDGSTLADLTPTSLHFFNK